MNRRHANRPRNGTQRSPDGPWLRALDSAGGVIAAGVFVLLLSTECPTNPGPEPTSLATVDVNAVDTQSGDFDPDSAAAQVTDDGTGATAEGTASVGTTLLGGGVDAKAEVNGADTEATATADVTVCFTANASTSPDVSMIYNHKIEKFGDGADCVHLVAEVEAKKNDEDPVIIFNGLASANCGDANITSSGFAPFNPSIPGFRYFSSAQPSFPDVFAVVPGDHVSLSGRLELVAQVVPGAEGGVEITSSQDFTYDFGLQQIVCAPPECEDAEDCSSGEFCEQGTCREPTFGTEPLNITVNTGSDPLEAGQPFGFELDFQVYEGDLFPFFVDVTTAAAALDWVGVAASNQIVGFCSVGPSGGGFGTLNFNVLTTLDANQLYIDLDGNVAFGAADVSIEITEGASLGVEIGIPNGGDGDATTLTSPIDATFSCEGFYGMFNAGSAGSHQVVVDAISVDPDSGDADDETGLDPLTKQVQSVLSISGEPLCGTGAGGAPGVGSPGLEASYDVDGNGTVGALTDGILILRYLFGFSGTTLAAGAIGAGATRADPADIDAFLDCLATTMLDVDDNDTIGALTDGLLIVRHTFGFSGTTLTNGALGGGAQRTDPTALATFMNQFIP